MGTRLAGEPVGGFFLKGVTPDLHLFRHRRTSSPPARQLPPFCRDYTSTDCFLLPARPS